MLPHACQLLTCPRCPPAAPPTHTYHEQGTDKKGNPIQYDLEGPINFSVFPGLQVRCARCARCAVLPPTQSAAEWIRALQYHAMRCNVSRPRLTPAARCPAPHDAQGGPHNHTISGLACALKQAATPEFKAYQEQVWGGGWGGCLGGGVLGGMRQHVTVCGWAGPRPAALPSAACPAHLFAQPAPPSCFACLPARRPPA